MCTGCEKPFKYKGFGVFLPWGVFYQVNSVENQGTFSA